jgi:hypothetical protein
MTSENLGILPLHSNEYEQFICREPGFLTKWSPFIFLLVLSLTLCFTWFFTYPDTIETFVTFTGKDSFRLNASLYLEKAQCRGLYPLQPIHLCFCSLKEENQCPFEGKVLSIYNETGHQRFRVTILLEQPAVSSCTTGISQLVGVTGMAQVSFQKRLFYRLIYYNNKNR